MVDTTRGQAIAAAFSSMDPGNDEIWTSDGLPSLDVLSEATELEVSRKEVDEATGGQRRPGADMPAISHDERQAALDKVEEELAAEGDEPLPEVAHAHDAAAALEMFEHCLGRMKRKCPAMAPILEAYRTNKAEMDAWIKRVEARG